MGTAVIGIGMRGFLGVPLAERLIATLGWRWMYLSLGLRQWAITLLPAMIFLMRRQPEEMGILADGATSVPMENPSPRLEGAKREPTAHPPTA